MSATKSQAAPAEFKLVSADFVQSLIKINKVDAIPNLSKQLLFVTAYKLLVALYNGSPENNKPAGAFAMKRKNIKGISCADDEKLSTRTARYLSIGALNTIALALLSSSAVAGVGEDVAAEMKRYYMATVDSCDGGKLPAYYCSGLMIRGTSTNPKYYTWNPSPDSKISGGVSFEYLRADTKFKDPGVSKIKGFVFQPYSYLKPGMKRTPQVLCSFPIDSWTNNRNDLGCGDHSETVSLETACELKNVHTAEQWVADYLQVGANHKEQCGFRHVSARNGADGVAQFYASVRARSLLMNESAQLKKDTFETQNELRLATWPDDSTSLPIMAFFYVEDPHFGSGLKFAQHDQQDWVVKTGHSYVPIIKIIYPPTINDHAAFVFNPADQVVCPKYFDASTWSEKDGKWSLVVTPSACGRTIGTFDSQAASKELMDLHGQDSQFKALPSGDSLPVQISCLASNYRGKSRWYLEPWRSARGLTEAQVLAAGCNP